MAHDVRRGLRMLSQRAVFAITPNGEFCKNKWTCTGLHCLPICDGNQYHYFHHKFASRAKRVLFAHFADFPPEASLQNCLSGKSSLKPIERYLWYRLHDFQSLFILHPMNFSKNDFQLGNNFCKSLFGWIIKNQITGGGSDRKIAAEKIRRL